MTQFEDRNWTTRDGLALHYRDYAGPPDRPPVVCLHALTRNARDFDALAARLAGSWRVIVPEMRGRGDSEYARDAASYNPAQYAEDTLLLLDELDVARAVFIGTSLGGLMIMLLAMAAPDRIVGAALNDIGPVLEPAGLERIKGYVGQGGTWPTWVHAARALEETQGAAFPGHDISDWLAMAKRLMTLTSNGRIVYDYDMKIAEAFAATDGGEQPDLWPGVSALAGKPVLIVRGALSDLFSPATLAAMMHALPGAEAVTVAGAGHAPSLSEPEAAEAIDRLLARIA